MGCWEKVKKPTAITVLMYEPVVSLQRAVLVTLLGTGAQLGQVLEPVSLPAGFLLSEHLQDPVGSSLCHKLQVPAAGRPQMGFF